MTLAQPVGTIGGFTLLEDLGRGAAAQVFRARRVGGPPTEYALKLLAAGPDGPGTGLAALCREAALLACVDHPGLVVIHEVGEDAGRPYLVMDLLDGRTLADLLAAGPMPPDRVLTAARDLAGLLAAVHRRGLVHRDLKPGNIMILPDGHARLIDFGLADRHPGTVSTAAAGTLVYAAPEQTGLLRRPPDHRCDLYSLGAVLFECLAGYPPFVADDVAELLRLHAAAPPPDLVELVPGVPAGLAVLIATLLAKDPDDRYDGAEQVAADLERIDQAMRAGPGRADPFVPHRVAPRWAGSAQRRNAVVGRSAELARLRVRWDATREGLGGVQHVTGPAGVGKSALAAELAAVVEGSGALVLHGRSTPDDQVPLAPLREALAGHLAQVERLPPRLRDQAQARLVAAAGADAPLVRGLTPGLGRVLDGPALVGPARPVPGGGPAVPDADRFDLAVVGLLTGLAEAHGGLLLVLDDAQWLDPVTARVLARLEAELDGVPMLVLMLTRADGDRSDDRLDLERLPDAAVAELVRVALPGADPGPRLAELIVTRSSGNPLVAHEYLRAIVDAGLLRPHWGDWTLDEVGLQALDLPQDAVGLVLARLGRLPARTTDLLATAAVIGTRFTCGTVAAVHGLDDADVVAAVGEAAGHGLLEPQGEGVFAFVHEALRHALLAELAPDEAARRHLATAAAYGAEPVPSSRRPAEHVFAVAHHYLAGGAAHAASEAVRGQAFEAWWRAGLLALRSHAPAQAVQFLRAARGLAPPAVGEDDERGGPWLALRLGIALHRSDAFDDAATVLGEALTQARAPFLRARILLELADLRRAMWQPELALDTVRQGLAELGARLPSSRVGLLVTTGWLFGYGSVVHRTGWRFGTARGAELQRCRLIAQFHAIAGFTALLNGSLDLPVLFSMRVGYWANRIGAGPDYLAARTHLMYLLLGLRRGAAAERVFARLRADPAWADPMVRARFLDARGGAYYFFGRDDGELLGQVLIDHGRWLEASVFRDGCDALALHEADAGRTRLASTWSERATRRLASVGEAGRTPVHRFTLAVLEAMHGRPARATSLLRETEAALPQPCPAGIAVVHRLAELILLREQDETGEPFDQAVAAFEALRLPPRAVLRMHRVVFFHIAMGRLAQARRASDAERPGLLVRARAALKELRRFRRDADLRALERVARADLLLQEGDARRALRALAETDDTDRHDVPIAAYEGALVRARALAVLGLPQECDRQARFAVAVAEEEGWPHRAARAVAEFGIGANRPSPTASAAWRTSRSPAPGTSRPGDVQAQRQQQRLQALQQVSLAASRLVDPMALARISLDGTIRILGAERAFLFLVDEQGRLVPFLGRSADGDDVGELTGYSASLVERVHGDGHPLVVTGTEEGAALGAQSVVLHGLRSIVIAPLRLEQRRLGVVYLDSQVAKGIFASDDVEILTALTTHIATSLETARAAQLAISVQTARRERDLAERLREASQTLAGATSPDLVLSGLLDWARRLTRCDAGWVVVRGRDGERLHGTAGPRAGPAEPGEPGEPAEPGEPVAPDDALDALLAADQPVVGSPQSVPAALRAELGGAAWLAWPLRSGELDAGVLVLRAGGAAGDASGSDALSGAVDVVSALVAQAVTAYDRAALFARVQALAVADELTGVANRRHFFDVARRDVETSRLAGRPLAAVMVDIDHFKAVNDTYGHPTGDDVIRTVAERLAEQLRSTDLLGRYGGEEFAIVMLDVPEPFGLAERLRRAVASAPVPTRSGPLAVTVSVGLARLCSADDLESLLSRADRALYRAKQAGRDRVCDDG